MTGLARSLGAAGAGYAAACLTAGFAYAFILAAAIQVTGSIAEPSEMSAVAQFQSLVTFAVLASLLIAVVAFLPFLLALAVMLLFGRTELVFCIAAAVAVSAVSVSTASRTVLFMDKLRLDWVIVSAAVVAGVVFWAVFRSLAPREAAAA